MPGILPAHRRRFPLHVHISALFALLLMTAGTLLGLFNYRQASQIIFSSSDRLFESIRDDVQQDLQQTYRPIRQLLDLLALAPSVQSADLATRLQLLPALAQALRDNPQLASLYIGQPDGEFFMVRPLRNAAERERFKAPARAAFQIWSIEHNAANGSRHLFYDDALRLLADRPQNDQRYDPRARDWYRSALADNIQITTHPYLFFSSGELGTTLARRVGNGVMAADLTLADLSQTLARHRVTPSTELVLVDAQGRAVAYPDSQKLLERDAQGNPRRVSAASLNPSIAALLEHPPTATGHRVMKLDNRRWVVSLSHLNEGGPQGLDLALLVPEDELLADAYRIRWQGALITLGVLLFSLPIGWLSSRVISRPLAALAAEAEAVRSFDFSGDGPPRSLVLEIDEVAVAMARMKHNLASFMALSNSLSSQTHFSTLLERILMEIVEIADVDGGVLYLLDEDSGQLDARGLILDGGLKDPNDFGLNRHEVKTTAPDWLQAPSAGGASETRSLGFDAAGALQAVMHALDCPRINLLSCGLHSRQGTTHGVLVLLQRDESRPAWQQLFRPERIAFIEAISGVAGMCIHSQRLLESQKQLLDAFIQLIAGAIDAKSPYTGGHCQRVPELTLMLARAAERDERFPDYQPSPDDWEALRTAAWLHDCGKVTTPEYVVDKATKLESLNDRIHEIRMRFEVLKRDAWIDYWQARLGDLDEKDLRERLDRQLATLDDEFAFVASCNLGAESTDDDDIARLERIAERRWLRTLDDRLGVSHAELERKQRGAAAQLPVYEQLLADKPEHLIKRLPGEQLADDNPWRFKVDTPQHRFNRGELYNLKIRRGTLTPEERYIINGHMLQTIRMLETLPFPAHLRQVPEIAGGHHEKMDGSGYPRRLTGEQLSLPARIMAIADIFEALTAADRPYKEGKRLSESLAIMAGMSRNGHIDPQLFELFIRARVYRDYAQRFLAREQIDRIDEEALLASAAV